MSRRRSGLNPAAGGARRVRGPRWWRNLSPRRRLVLRLVLAGIAAVVLLLAAMVAYAAMTLPDLNKLGEATGTIKILDRHGQVIASIGHDAQSRNPVPLDKVAKVMQESTLAAEDRNFYNEGAFDVPRVVKALFVDVIARRPQQGASTITQQLAKLAFFGSNASKSPLRKLREALLANEIDSRYRKDEILDKYLNLIYYGEGAYGVQNAAQTFFGKDAKDLDLREASLLAGLPQAPSAYDPNQNPELAFARQHYVLTGLVAMGAASQQEADAVDPEVGGANPTPVQVAQQQANQKALHDDLLHGKPLVAQGIAPHFVQYVRDQLQEKFADDPNVTAGDLTVTTTLDLSIQARANAAVVNGVKAIGRKANNGALLMVDSHSGDIIAMVGSANFSDNSINGQYNNTTGPRQPGSSFKPYVYEEGFINGRLKPSTVLDDTRAESQKLGGVMDFDRSFMGRITAARALLESRNVPAEQAMVMAGIPDVIDFAHQVGISTDLAPNPSTAIGSSAVKMIDHAAGYAAFSNYGHKVTPRAIVKVVDGNGNTLVDEPSPPQGDQVMTPQQAYAITKILRGYPARWGVHFNRPIAAKSGTTENFVDAWYMAYSPDYVVGTWVANTPAGKPEQGMDSVYGNDVGAAVAQPFINGLPGPIHDFPVVAEESDCNSSNATAVSTGCASPSASSSPTSSGSPSPSPTTTGPLPTFTLSPSPKQTFPITTTTSSSSTTSSKATTTTTSSSSNTSTTAASSGGPGP
jgi:membrane peptidoglycan carboxypeptidase